MAGGKRWPGAVGIFDATTGWSGDVVAQITSISLPILLIALVLRTGEMLLNAVAWRNILRAAYPSAGVRLRPVLGAYAGGIALNALLPAQAGTVAMLGLYRAQIQQSSVAGLLGASFVQNVVYLMIGAVLCLILVASRPASFDVHFAWAHQHTLLVLVGVAVSVIAGRILWRRFRRSWTDAVEGAAILTHPHRYVTQVAGLQLASYVLRLGVTGTFLLAYHIPVSARTIFLVLAANSISSTFALTPGGLGSQQVLASVALRRVAASNVVAAFSLGQQLIVMAWDVILGLFLLGWTIGWRATSDLLHRTRPAPAAVTPTR
jgi:uncharacterized membrane protein YbhN (UPF0104 family)